MSYPFRVTLAVLMAIVALVFLALGALELIGAQNGLNKPCYRLFFSLAAVCVGAAAGTLLS